MLHMLKDNKIIITYLFLISFYGLYVYFDHVSINLYTSNLRDIINKHRTNLYSKEINSSLDCIILGGSNSFYSLSANIINDETNFNCYNASLLNEGSSYNNYNNWISEISNILDKDKIKIIFYSSIQLYSAKEKLVQYQNNFISIDGKKEISIQPNLTILSKLKEVFNKSEPLNIFPLPDKSGDFIFEDFNYSYLGSSRYYFNAEDYMISFLINRSKYIVSNFPNAKIYLIFPSVLSINQSKPIKFFEDQIKSKFDFLKKNELILKDKEINIIFQSEFISKDFVSDDNHHSNDKGRTWRTKDLLKYIK